MDIPTATVTQLAKAGVSGRKLFNNDRMGPEKVAQTIARFAAAEC